MTVERHVYLKFADEFSNAAAIDKVVERTHRDLSGIDRVVRIRVGRPADERSGVAWDLVLVVELASADDVAPYLQHPDHRDYYESFLKPRLEVIKAWNFEFDADR